MQSRLPAGAQAATTIVIAVALFAVSTLPAPAATLRSTVDRAESGLQAVDGQEDRLDDRIRFARSAYAWPYARGPHYGQVAPSVGSSPGVLRTRVGSFDLTAGALDIPIELKAGDSVGQLGVQYFVISLDPQAGEAVGELRESIAASGGAVVQAMPVSALVVRLTPGGVALLQGRPELVALAPYQPAFKLDPTIGRVPLPDPVKALSEVYDLDVRVWPGEDSRFVADTLAKLGGNLISIFPDTVRVEIHRSQLAAVAALQPVQFVTEHLPLSPRAEETTTTTQTGRWNNGAVPYHDAGIDGSGGGIPGTGAQVLMVLDTGIQIDAGDMSHTSASVGTVGPGHRKVRRYETTEGPLGAWGGEGDLLGCDAPGQGGFTHGQFVSSVALGNGTDVDPSYGEPWYAMDQNGNRWKLDGVAPGALLVGFDGQLTPPAASCSDPLQDTVSPGDLYSGGATGSLGSAYEDNGARVFNFSWGGAGNAYTANAQDIDTFLFDKRNAMIFVSAGNAGRDEDPEPDGIPDEGSLGTPATAKNGLAIGASRNANDLGSGIAPAGRAFFSSVGPAPGDRIAPQLMAPGDEAAGGDMGLSSEFGCRSGDNDQSNPVECDIISGIEGTSFSSPAAAGAALLVRDYFAQGFYPDGTSGNPGNSADQKLDLSGALVKSMLIASAEFMDGANLSWGHRFNNEQGYGRIQLDNALPLESWSLSATGLIVVDGDGSPGFGDLSGLSGVIDVTASPADSESATFQVCDTSQPLRVALAWLEPYGEFLINDLDLELQAPSEKLYKGNYFTDDNDRDRVLQSHEDCPHPDGVTLGKLEAAAWSLPWCANGANGNAPGTGVATNPDGLNPTEAIMLSPDYDGDGASDLNPDDDNQIEFGQWTITVKAKTNAIGSPAQRYAVVVAGGVCIGSSVRFDEGAYNCNSVASITVNEVSEPGDSAPDVSHVEQRTTVEVIAFDVCDDKLTACEDAGDCAGIGGGTCNAELVVDAESGAALSLIQPHAPALQFVSEKLFLTDGTAYDPGNGVLDVRSGNELRVIYQDVDSNGLPDPDKRRESSVAVNCDLNLAFGDIVFAQFGQDTGFFVSGGCERNERQWFDFGYPDRYMDADELVSYNFAFASNEDQTLHNVLASLRCVHVDVDSPEGCRPNTAACDDPNRLNNLSCDGVDAGAGLGVPYMAILDSPVRVSRIPAYGALSANFSIQMVDPLPGRPEVELVLEVSSNTSGKTNSGVAINRHTLDVDEESLYYSTDFPTGGTEVKDRNNNEVEENPTSNIGDFQADYRFETVVWSDLTAGGKNSALNSPWNFDSNRGGFTSGVSAATDDETISDVIAQWGEDKNFNDQLDGYCNVDTRVTCVTKTQCFIAGAGNDCIFDEDRDLALNDSLDSAWGTAGGCGWQTRAPSTCSNDSARGCWFDADCDSPGVCTGAGQAAGGIWHTGLIGNLSGECLVLGNNPGQCQAHETVSGTTGQRTWFEMLASPEIQKVNGAEYKIEITDWSWNQALDLVDSNLFWSWELDTDTQRIEPVDLKSDTTVLNFGSGAYGPVVNANNPDLTNGFSVFAPVQGSCAYTGTLCKTNANCPMTCWNGGNHCELASNCLGAFCEATGGGSSGVLCNDPGNTDEECVLGLCAGGVCTGLCIDNYCDNCTNAVDANGTQGNNREAQNSCFFRGPAGIKAAAFATLGLPGPPDDDIDNDTDGMIDEYVRLNGPVRNMDIVAFNGPDMRFNTLEDIYGDSGETFQAAIGMFNFEKGAESDPDPKTGYGVGVDDMVIEWREFRLTDDATTCDVGGGGSGECAVIDLQTSNMYDGNTLVTITVLEKSPPTANDCDFDGTPDTPVTTDCDSNGTVDVVVRATTETELTGEIVFANLVSGDEYKADLPVSSLYDVAGVLFAQPTGTDQPTVTVLYIDDDDGTGSICKNSVDPAAWGRVEAASTLFLSRGNVAMIDVRLSDNGDDDGWADSDETVTMQIQLSNKTGVDLSGIVARLLIDNADFNKIECIINPAINFGDLEADESRFSTGAFEFKVTDIDRDDLSLTDLDDLSVTLKVVLAANEFDAALAPQTVTLDLDLNATGGTAPQEYVEGFESGTFGTFTTMNLDDGKSSEVASEGYRCQYTDPDWINSNSYGQIADCWLAATPTQATEYFWDVQDGEEAFGTDDTGHTFDGKWSVYMGVFDDTADDWTTPLAVMEALVQQNPVNLGWDKVCETTRTTPCVDAGDCPGVEACVPAAPELSFKHQISLTDSRQVNASPFESADGAALGLQLANAGGVPVGDWLKVTPYTNVYDSQRSDNFTNCFFDPIDDGSTEDDFFDPSDPDRRLGPSTLCFPEFVFVHLGDTDNPFADNNIGNASDGPGLCGDGDPTTGCGGTGWGAGTWVESKVNLTRFRGRRARIRFINSAIKAGTQETMESLFQWNPTPVDDGWWIDDVRVRDTLDTAATMSNDSTDNSGLAQCPLNCQTITAKLSADPVGALPAPGQVVELNAADPDDPSLADVCLQGTLQFQFWADGNGDNQGGNAADTLLRGWTDNPVLLLAPLDTATYVAEVRCSTATSCVGSASLVVTVNCPASGTLSRALGVFSAEDPDPVKTVGWLLAYGGSCAGDPQEFCSSNADCGTSCIPAAPGELLFGWPPEPDKGRRVRITQTIEGNGVDLTETKAASYTILRHWERQLIRGFRVPPDGGVPAGTFYWYLMTHDDEACNVGGSWQTQVGAETGRDSSLP